MRLSSVVAVGLSLSVSPGLRVQAPKGTTTRSEQGRFSVHYPAGWNQVPSGVGVVEIANFPWSQRVRGVVLPRSGADISVVAAPDSVHRIEDWTTRDSLGAKNLARRLIALSRAQPGRCTRLIEVQRDVDEGPGTYIHETIYYCEVQGRLFSIGLSNWAGNPSQRKLQAVALTVALSLRPL